MTACNRLGCHVTGGNGLDLPNPVDYPTAYKRVQIYLNCGTPAASPFLTKQTRRNGDAHSGGDIFAEPVRSGGAGLPGWFQ